MKLLSDLRRHAGEFLRALANGHYERTPSGIVFPRQRVHLGGVFTALADGVPVALGHNLVMNAALNTFLNQLFRNAAQNPNYYIAPFSNNLAPVATLTAANFNENQTEFVNYTEASRPAWTTNGASTAQALSNSNSLAQYTFGTGGGTVHGAALFTVATKGASTGLLVSAGLFDSSAALNAGGRLQIQYDFLAADGTPP